MDRTLAEQQRRNAESRDAWQPFAEHRKTVMRLLAAARESAESRLCVLGAGNCNDLDLGRLVTLFRQVHLVDLDGSALTAAAARQQCDQSPALFLHGGIDLAGIADRLSNYTPQVPMPEAEITACLAQAASAPIPTLRGPFDTVASLCLLTQLIDAAVLSLGDGHPRLPELVLALRKRHWQILLGLLRPGGTAFLISDFVSSETVPRLPSTPAADLIGLMLRCIQEHNFFTGANPFALQTDLQNDPQLAAQTASVTMLGPWTWSFTARRTYAVCAIRARKRAG